MRLSAPVRAIAGTAFVSLAVHVDHSAIAGTITVTSTSGETGGPECTLRDALTSANSDAPTGGCPAGSGSDIIELAPSATYTLTVVDNFTVGGNGLPKIPGGSTITINGQGATIERSGG